MGQVWASGGKRESLHAVAEGRDGALPVLEFLCIRGCQQKALSVGPVQLQHKRVHVMRHPLAGAFLQLEDAKKNGLNLVPKVAKLLGRRVELEGEGFR